MYICKNFKTIKMKLNKIGYYVTTGLLSLLMLFSAGMYFFNHAEVAKLYEGFGYPTYIIYPYGIAKVLGLVAIWFVKDNRVKEWAYAGYFFAFILAFFAHVMISDGQQAGAILAMVLLIGSYVFRTRLATNK